MRGVRRRLARKSGLLVLLALFAWLFLVLVILPRRRREAALAVGDMSVGEHELSRVERLATHPPEASTLLADGADLAGDVPQVLARWDDVPPEPDLAGPTVFALAAVPDTPAGDLDVHPDVQPLFNRRDRALRAPPVHEETTLDQALLDRLPKVRDDELQGLLAPETHALDVDSSLDPKPVAKRQTVPPGAVGVRDAQLGARVYLGALWRFRWLIPVAMCAAIVLPLLMLYRPVWPPGLVARSAVSYVTTTQLLVDSPSGPFLRIEPKSSAPEAVTPGSETQAQGSSQASDRKSLVDAANLFPLMMESDEVMALRQTLIGNVPGTVRATALFAGRGASRYRPSVLPVMEIIAVAPDRRRAYMLGQGTARAFSIWLEREQNRTSVAKGERIVLRQLRRPSTAVQTGGPAYGMPILAGLALLGAFVGLVVAIDRALPRARAGQPSMIPVDAVPSAQDGPEARPVEPQGATHESSDSHRLWRISETLTEARVGSRSG